MPLKKLIKSVLGIKSGAGPSATKLPKVDVASLFPARNAAIQMLETATTNGNATIQEVFTLNFAVAARRPRTVFEIGTFDGRTTVNLAANTPPDTKIFTLDLPAAGLNQTKFALEDYDRMYVDKPASGTRFKGTEAGVKITQLLGDSATFDFSPYFDSIDFVFVDGSHAYEYAFSDSLNALKLLRKQTGVILWHDYGHVCWPGVARALEELQATHPRFKNLVHIQDTTIACLLVESNGSKA